MAKRGRKPLPPEIKAARRAKQMANRHVLQVSFVSAALRDEANILLGNVDRQKTLLCALHYWRGTNGTLPTAPDWYTNFQPVGNATPEEKA